MIKKIIKFPNISVFIFLGLLNQCNAKYNHPMDGAGGVLADYLVNNPLTSVTNLNPIVTLPTGISNVSVTQIPVKLDIKPSSNIGVTVTTSSTGITLSPTTMTFTPNNYHVEQILTATVSILNTCGPFDALTFTLTAGSTFAKTYTLPITSRVNVKCTFVTTATTAANFGGVSGGDAFCMNNIPSDLNGVGSGTYKAFMAISGIRTQSPLLDWVIQPGNYYFRSRTVRIGIANSSSLFDIPLENGFSLGTANIYTGTGPGPSCLSSSSFPAYANNCSNFTSTIGNQYTLMSTSSNLMPTCGPIDFCTGSRAFLCIEQ